MGAKGHRITYIPAGPLGHHIESVASGLCLTRGNDVRGSYITSSSCNASDGHQKWVLERSLKQIRTPQGQCMDDGGDFIHIWDCIARSDNQYWTWSHKSGHVRNIEDLCVAAGVNKGNVGLISCDDSEQLQWRLHPEPAVPEDDADDEGVPEPMVGTRLIWQNGFCLDASGPRAHIWSCADVTLDTEWEQDPKTMQLRTGRGLCLDASNSTFIDRCNGTRAAQQWIVDNRTGRIRNGQGLFCLANMLPLGNGNPVRLEECSRKGFELHWTLHPTKQSYWT